MEKKRNYSKKREAILKAVCSTKTHPTAEWVYATLKPDYSDLSLGTVYRNLSQLKNDGVIISVGVVNGQERYDGNTAPHTHFVCSECGAVLDVPGDFISEKQILKAARSCEFQIDSFEVVLKGVCQDCLKKREALKNSKSE